jgi:hypothetical protein
MVEAGPLYHREPIFFSNIARTEKSPEKREAAAGSSTPRLGLARLFKIARGFIANMVMSQWVRDET